MKERDKVEVVLSWDDGNYACKFKRGSDQCNWPDLSRDDQLRAVGAMITMAEMFHKFIKEDGND